MSFINEKLAPINAEDLPYRFDSAEELIRYVKANEIDDRQEFWFSVKGEDILFSCVFDYYYEG